MDTTVAEVVASKNTEIRTLPTRHLRNDDAMFVVFYATTDIRRVRAGPLGVKNDRVIDVLYPYRASL